MLTVACVLCCMCMCRCLVVLYVQLSSLITVKACWLLFVCCVAYAGVECDHCERMLTDVCVMCCICRCLMRSLWKDADCCLCGVLHVQLSSAITVKECWLLFVWCVAHAGGAPIDGSCRHTGLGGWAPLGRSHSSWGRVHLLSVLSFSFFFSFVWV